MNVRGEVQTAGPWPEVLLVHDYLLVMRGAERAFKAMAECWPDAPIATLLHDPAVSAGHFDGHVIRTSPLQRLGVRQGGFRGLLPLLPLMANRLRLPPSDVVVSSSSAFAHGVEVPPGQQHICYCHSPFRYAWHERDRALEELPPVLRRAGAKVLDRVRDWDLEASSKVDRYVANSAITGRRIKEYYGRDATVVHPPVELERFRSDEPQGYVLLVGELTRHKNPEIACEAAARVRRPLVVVGDGPERSTLERRYAGRVRFLGRVDDERLTELYAHAEAVVVPAIEEFGIVAAEAGAAGRPVVAAAAGGALEIVQDGLTGVLVPPRDVRSLAEVLHDVRWDDFDERVIRAGVQRFSRARFQDAMRSIVSGTGPARPALHLAA